MLKKKVKPTEPEINMTYWFCISTSFLILNNTNEGKKIKIKMWPLKKNFNCKFIN